MTHPAPVDLPPMPEPKWTMPERMAGEWKIPGAWSSDQLIAYAQLAVNEALEAAAVMASYWPAVERAAPLEIAAAIRALKAG